MSILNKVTGLFWETEKSTEPVNTKKEESKETQKAPVTYVTPPAAPSNPSTVTEFRKHFENILKENNLPGNDFYEFKLMKDNMQSAIPDESQRYTVAFSGLQAAGLTKDTLLLTANKYVAVVEAEMANFNAAYEQQYKVTVTDVDKTVTDKTAKMNDLAQQINVLSKDISELKQKSMESSQSLQDKKNGFLMAAMNQKDELLSEIAKIQQYIN